MIDILFTKYLFFKFRYTYSDKDLLFVSHGSIIEFRNLIFYFLILFIPCFLEVNTEAKSLLVLLVPLILFLVFNLFKTYFFKVLLIYDTHIKVVYPYNPAKNELFHLLGIRRIKYFPPLEHSPNKIRIYLKAPKDGKQQKYSLLLDDDIYKFAHTLKYLKEQGIEINFSQRDSEIEGFIAGKYESIPLMNKY